MKFNGQKINGNGFGRKIGFPTINLIIESPINLDYGVYVVRATRDDCTYNAVMHLGNRPTFGSEQERIEIHLIDQKIDDSIGIWEIEVIRFIRKVKKFVKIEDLIEQIKMDVAIAKEILIV